MLLNRNSGAVRPTGGSRSALTEDYGQMTASPLSAPASLAFRGEAAFIKGAIAALALLAAFIAAARAAPPENADPALAPWFQSLEVPGTNHSSCCSQSDCRPVDYRVVNDYYEALLTPEQFARAGVLQSQ